MKQLLILCLLLAGCVRPHDDRPKPRPVVPPAPVVVVDPTAPKGFRALIMHDTTANETRDQLAVIYSPDITKWLNEHCVKGPKDQPEWRRWDIAVELDDIESKDIRDLWLETKGKTTPPALIIAKDAKAKIHPLPATPAAALELLKTAEGGQ